MYGSMLGLPKFFMRLSQHFANELYRTNNVANHFYPKVSSLSDIYFLYFHALNKNVTL